MTILLCLISIRQKSEDMQRGDEAHGREQYKGHTGNQPLRIVSRLHSSPVAYMDRMETVRVSAGAEKGRCGSAHAGIQAGTQ